MTAASVRTAQPDQDHHYDNGGLVQLFEKINRRYFNNRIQASLRWEIPAGTVSVPLVTQHQPLSDDHPLHDTFASAVDLLRRNAYRDALPLLIDCAEGGHQEGHLLLNHLLKRLGDERWGDYVRRYNRQQDSHKLVPAACYYPDTRIIALHPYIHERRAPQFVLKYLIFHECCHQLIESECDAPHPPEFMALEYRAPGRERALEWLEKEGFPTLAMSEEHSSA